MYVYTSTVIYLVYTFPPLAVSLVLFLYMRARAHTHTYFSWIISEDIPYKTPNALCVFPKNRNILL